MMTTLDILERIAVACEKLVAQSADRVDKAQPVSLGQALYETREKLHTTNYCGLRWEALDPKSRTDWQRLAEAFADYMRKIK